MLDFIGERELVAVPELRFAGCGVSARHLDRLLHVLHLVELRGRGAEGIDQSVRAVGAVVRLLVVVSTVTEVADAPSVRADAIGIDPHRLIDPIPDAAAGELV